VTVLAPGTLPADLDRGFVRLALAAGTARDADAFQAPAPGSQADPSDYAAFVSTASRQAARSHPGIELLAGLSAGAARSHQSADALFDAFLRTRLTVTGYAFNAAPGPPLAAGLGFLRKLSRLES
jgi:hypothetical protein